MKTNIFNNLNGKGLKIAIVQARFNQDITKNLLDGALSALKQAGVNDKYIKITKVPGSFEIPLTCQKLARMKKFDGIIALGAIIKGETAHFDYIAKAATDGIMRTMLDYKIPIAFGIITTYTLAQAKKRSVDSKKNSGYGATLSLIETINNLK
ncbi:6,7-dimethyl-8-ribityllumazine synthase [Candidatus Parcubacteria bacterium]|nr:6,7-dimethyl-8-ribityllumazine synthase [Candidatus Parcubacteria bacterium]